MNPSDAVTGVPFFCERFSLNCVVFEQYVIIFFFFFEKAIDKL